MMNLILISTGNELVQDCPQPGGTRNDQYIMYDDVDIISSLGVKLI